VTSWNRIGTPSHFKLGCGYWVRVWGVQVLWVMMWTCEDLGVWGCGVWTMEVGGLGKIIRHRV